MLKAEELVVNRKHTSRSYAEEKLQLRSQRKNKFKGPRMPLVVSIGANIRWSIDFVSDSLSNGRRFRVLNIKDDYSRELIGQLVSYSLSGLQVARFLDQLIEKESAPDQIKLSERIYLEEGPQIESTQSARMSTLNTPLIFPALGSEQFATCASGWNTKTTKRGSP